MADNDTQAERIAPRPSAAADERPTVLARPAGQLDEPRAPRAAQPRDPRLPPLMPQLDAFLTVGDANRLRDLLAFAMAVESGRSSGPEAMDSLRREADAALETHAFRTLHNRVEQIRRDAVDEQIGLLRPPPGLVKLVFANLLAVLILAAGAVAAWRLLGPSLLPMLGA